MIDWFLAICDWLHVKISGHNWKYINLMHSRIGRLCCSCFRLELGEYRTTFDEIVWQEVDHDTWFKAISTHVPDGARINDLPADTSEPSPKDKHDCDLWPQQPLP